MQKKLGKCTRLVARIRLAEYSMILKCKSFWKVYFQRSIYNKDNNKQHEYILVDNTPFTNRDSQFVTYYFTITQKIPISFGVNKTEADSFTLRLLLTLLLTKKRKIESIYQNCKTWKYKYVVIIWSQLSRLMIFKFSSSVH